MGKRRRSRVDMLTLEQQLGAMPHRPTFPVIAEPWMGDHVGPTIVSQVEWDRRRSELLDAIKRRDAKRLRDPGKDASGNFDVSPYAARGHQVAVAQKKLGAELPKDGSFPKRIETQRMIDRYKIRSQITLKQFRAAEFLLEAWQASGLEPSMVANYDPVNVSGNSTKDALIAKRVDAATTWVALIDMVPYRSRGVVRAVVVEDLSAGEWALARGYRRDDSGRIGMGRLRSGLSALVVHLGY